eukprot:2213522-Pleurochrysis_carterae.AAC.1
MSWSGRSGETSSALDPRASLCGWLCGWLCRWLARWRTAARKPNARLPGSAASSNHLEDAEARANSRAWCSRTTALLPATGRSLPPGWSTSACSSVHAIPNSPVPKRSSDAAAKSCGRPL